MIYGGCGLDYEFCELWWRLWVWWVVNCGGCGLWWRFWVVLWVVVDDDSGLWVVLLGGNRLWVVVVASIGSRLWWPVE